MLIGNWYCFSRRIYIRPICDPCNNLWSSRIIITPCRAEYACRNKIHEFIFISRILAYFALRNVRDSHIAIKISDYCVARMIVWISICSLRLRNFVTTCEVLGALYNIYYQEITLMAQCITQCICNHDICHEYANGNENFIHGPTRSWKQPYIYGT